MKLAVSLAALIGLVAVTEASIYPSNQTDTHSPHYQKAKRIVYAVFPKATEAAALRVVGCETGHDYTPWSYNSSSGASGYFQILQGNAGRILRYNGRTMRIPGGYRLFLPWTNTRVALFLSKGGTDWHEWTCQP